MLILIILGKESITLENMDVYLVLLIEKLQMLWIVVNAFDVKQGQTFSLKAMIMWSVHDFVAYKLFVGCVTKGSLVGCPSCGPTIESQFSKVLYCGGCRCLPRNHTYRLVQSAFNGQTENKGVFVRVGVTTFLN